MSKYRKYPRTPHLPFSPGYSNEDHVLVDDSCFHGKHVVVTEKMDGECTTMYNDHIHARSIESPNHPSRDWVKALHASIKPFINSEIRIIGENLFAKHSIYYENLRSYFYVFAICVRNIFHSWDVIRSKVRELGLELVPVLYEGKYNREKIDNIINNLDTEKQEGIVVRNAETFTEDSFSANVAKWVREKHIQTDEHWMNKEIVKNKLGYG